MCIFWGLGGCSWKLFPRRGGYDPLCPAQLKVLGPKTKNPIAPARRSGADKGSSCSKYVHFLLPARAATYRCIFLSFRSRLLVAKKKAIRRQIQVRRRILPFSNKKRSAPKSQTIRRVFAEGSYTLSLPAPSSKCLIQQFTESCFFLTGLDLVLVFYSFRRDTAQGGGWTNTNVGRGAKWFAKGTK